MFVEPPGAPAYHQRMTPRPALPVEDVSQIASSIFDRVREIKRRNPAVSRQIDRLEAEIHERLAEIRRQIARLDRRDRDLVTVMVIHGLQRRSEEVLVEK
jgi:hypothetical protein